MYIDNLINEMVLFSDLQEEVFNATKIKYPKASSMGHYSDLIEVRNLKLYGAEGHIRSIRYFTFENGIDNLLSNIKSLNLTVNFNNYESLIERLNKIKTNIKELGALEIPLGLNPRLMSLKNKNSLEYIIPDLKHMYDVQIYCYKDKEIRMDRFNIFKRKIDDVMTIKEISETYDIKADTVRKYMNRGAKDLIEHIDYKKSGATWLISKGGLEKIINNINESKA